MISKLPSEMFKVTRGIWKEGERLADSTTSIWLSQAECEGAARSIGWVPEPVVEWHKHYRDRIAELEHERDEWRAKFEATQQPWPTLLQCACGAKYTVNGQPVNAEGEPEKLTGLTHAEAERLMKETPGRVASHGPVRRRWANDQWEEWLRYDKRWIRDNCHTWKRQSSEWSIEPLPAAKVDDGLVPFGELKPGEWFLLSADGMLFVKTKQRDLINCVFVNGDFGHVGQGTRVRRVEGPR